MLKSMDRRSQSQKQKKKEKKIKIKTNDMFFVMRWPYYILQQNIQRQRKNN